ncbi:MAG: radical SAM family heme chaperone HemW [Bacilli bacterium]|nr:radical SAM family heme chaperone HemW [Bacilli bacterium]
MIKSCYVHIPFCKKICSYCDFCKLIYHKKFINSYLDALEKEIDSKYQGEVLDTLYIGGGTPTCLSYEELERLLKILSKLKLSKDIEYTIEGNVDSITIEKLELLKTYGINRLSIGVETTNLRFLQLLNRTLDQEKCRTLVDYARSIGIHNINFDLIYAIPGENIDDLEKDLDFILSLFPEHISTYSLIIEENTILGIKDTKNISEELDYEMYLSICKRLKENGYIHYEISNFSKPGYESKHNLCYWKNGEYYGFGLGSSSYIHKKRITNTRSITRYKEGIVLAEEELSLDDEIEYEVILGLRLLKGIDLRLFEEKYHHSLSYYYDVDQLIEEGYLQLNNHYLSIPEDKIYVSNEILVKILQNRK